MSPDPQDRRQPGSLADVIDEAVDIAEECGWRYALAYLISERVPPQIIQRLMFGGGRVRRAPIAAHSIVRTHPRTSSWGHDEEMRRLFDALHLRRTGKSHASNQPPLASRADEPHTEND
jgi:hypothetical protein